MVRRRSRTRHCVSRDHDAIDVDSATAKKSRAPNEREQEVKDEDKDDVEDDTITDEHRAYLKLVFDALTDGVSGYTLGKSMKELPFSETADDLEAHGYLEKEYLGNRQVYYRADEGRRGARRPDVLPEWRGERQREPHPSDRRAADCNLLRTARLRRTDVPQSRRRLPRLRRVRLPG